MPTPPRTPRAAIAPEALQTLVDALRARGYRVVGPTVRDGAIVLDELESADELPAGWVDRQDAGTYLRERRDDDARFGFSVGPHSPKQLLFPPHVRLWPLKCCWICRRTASPITVIGMKTPTP